MADSNTKFGKFLGVAGTIIGFIIGMNHSENNFIAGLITAAILGVICLHVGNFVTRLVITLLALLYVIGVFYFRQTVVRPIISGAIEAISDSEISNNDNEIYYPPNTPSQSEPYESGTSQKTFHSPSVSHYAYTPKDYPYESKFGESEIGSSTSFSEKDELEKLEVILNYCINNLSSTEYTGHDHNYGLGEGFRAKFYHLRSLFDYSDLLNILPSPLYKEGIHDEYLDLYNKKDFGHYNLELLEWIKDNKVIDLFHSITSSVDNNLFEEKFDNHLKDMWLTYIYIELDEFSKGLIIEKYKKIMAEEEDYWTLTQSEEYNIFQDARRKTGVLRKINDVHGYNIPETTFAFWLRRNFDKSHKSLFELLDDMMTLYFPEWVDLQKKDLFIYEVYHQVSQEDLSISINYKDYQDTIKGNMITESITNMNNEVFESGKYYIGFKGKNISSFYFHENRFDMGVQIDSLVINMPADNAGLRSGDVIYKLGDDYISNMKSFINHLNKNGHKRIRIGFIRKDEIMSTYVNPIKIE